MPRQGFRLQLFVLTFAMGLSSGASVGASATLQISGWHLPIPLDQPEPPDWLGQDTMIGRLSCPPLSYLDLSEGKSKPLLLKSIREQPLVLLGKIRKTWVFELRSGIYFWDETAVSAADLAEFLNSQLAKIINKTSGGIWQSPDFQVKVLNNREVQVQWEAEPPFGPYVVNHFPFFRTSKNTYQCAGVYRPESSKEALILLPVRAYSTTQPNLVFMPNLDSKDGYSIRLQIKNSTPKPKNPTEVAPDCQLKVDAPMMSLVFWNPTSHAAGSPEFRTVYGNIIQKALSPLTGAQRPELLPSILQPTDQSAKAANVSGNTAQQMLALGYTRNSTKDMLKDKSGQELKLTIKLGSSIDPDLQSTLQQAFLHEGINLQLIDRQNPSEADAFLSTMLVPMGNQNYLPFFHSRSRTGSTLTWRYQDAKMDELLERHLSNISQEQVSWDSLRAFQERAQEITPFTLALRYELCINSESTISEKRITEAKHLNFSWFRNLIL